MSEFDCVVIGAGPGGYVTAIRAAQLGMKTVVVERDRIGGRCLNYACIPAKLVLRTADVVHEANEAAEFGVVLGEPRIDFGKVVKRREQVVKGLTRGVGGLLKKNGVTVVEGAARLAGAGGVAVNGDVHHASTAVVLATGSVPRTIPGLEFGGRVIGTEEAWALTDLPASMVVVGAGASGAEIASGYARLGTAVHLIEALDRVLPAEDEEISAVAERGLAKQGIEIMTSTRISDVTQSDGLVALTAGDKRIEAEWLAVAAGRGPDIEGLGLADAEVELTGDGWIKVDGSQRTSAPGVWAIGDLVPGPALAHKSAEEGVIAVEDAAGNHTHRLDHLTIPRATFCTPQVGSFGLSEKQARDAGRQVVVGRVPYSAVGAGSVMGDRAGLVKLVGDQTTGELLGGHIVGGKATELVQQLVNTRAMEGGYADLARTIHGHPTLSEALMEAARATDGWLIHG
jgi:dihydrolipoamide dehydrogenase